MKSYILIIVLFSGLLYGQTDDVDFFSNNAEFVESDEDFTSEDQVEDEPGPDLPPRAPINDYLPLLAVAAVGIGFYFRKDLIQITKSK